jgi:hypothetical protein
MRAVDVRSPKSRWKLIEVLSDAGDGEDSLAIGEWDGNRVLAARWNGDANNPVGNPQSRGLPTWFILPVKYYEPLLKTLPEPKKVMARTLLRLEDSSDSREDE